MLASQYTFLTNYLSFIIAIDPAIVGSPDVSSWVSTQTPNPSNFLEFIWHLKYEYLFYPLAFVAGLSPFVKFYLNRRYPRRLILFIVASGSTMIFFSMKFILPGLLPGGHSRWALFAAPFCVILIASLYIQYPKQSSRGVLTLLLFIMIAAQIFSPVALVDGPTRQTYYLDSSEVQGKEFTTMYVEDPVYTDSFLAQEAVPSQIRFGESNYYPSYNKNLFNNKINSNTFKYLLYRVDQQYYRSGFGSVQLSYDPTQKLKSNTQTNLIYSNSGTELYYVKQN